MRDLTLAHLEDEPVGLVVADVSFISLVLLVAPLASVTRRDGRLLLMVKPQFEVGRELLGKGGVVRSAADRADAIRNVVDAARPLGWHPQGIVVSRVVGPAGNVEYFLFLGRAGVHPEPDPDEAVLGPQN